VAAADNSPLKTAAVQAHSAQLRKELGLFDLVLAQILIIIVADYMGTAVKAGSAHVVFWLVAIALFFVPLALVVIHMSRLLPVEGGLYEWARIAFNDQVGFLVAWNLWLYVILYVGLGGLVTVSFASYVIPGADWISSSKWLIVGASFAVIASTMCVAGLGLAVGKWLNNLGAVVFLVTVAALIALPFLNLWHGSLAEYHPIRLTAPPLTLFSVSVFSKMTFGALCGFEYVAVFAGECRDPKRHLPRSVLLTGPIVALIYILATSAILAFVPPSAEDVVAPIPQALSRGMQAFGLGHFVLPPAVLFLFIYYLATFCVFFTVSTRLPMVAGWDHLLPQWFSALQDTDQLRLIPGSRNSRRCPGRADRRRLTGIVRTPAYLELYVLRHRVPRPLCHTNLRAQRARPAPGAMGACSRGIGPGGDVAVRGPVDLSCN
jgi:amino acid transporter